ncbi:MAG: FadR family transcriptional regulator [Deltaproteobacteria bacterium]|nr:FadR family transcriptional regulator [Deltaproteobacteria bacterium]
MTYFKPIKQPRVSERVLDQLKEAILLGEFKSGEKLPSERELISEFQVSRGVIREALRALEMTGFIMTRQGPSGGSFVTDLSFNNLSNAFLDLFMSNKLSLPELVHFRNYIELEVARLAALNATDADKKRLLDAQDLEFKPFQNNSERIDRMQKVHLILAEVCGNHFFEAISKSLIRMVKEIVEAVEPDHEKMHMPGEHREIIHAVIEGDAEAAVTAMKNHAVKFRINLVNMEKTYRQRSSKQE